MELKAVDLFSGIGIGGLGLKRAGFRIVAAVDNDEGACKIYENNLQVKPKVGDLRKIKGSDILGEIGLQRGELDLVSGCPPCQGFSSLRRTRLKKKQKDKRKSLLRVFAQRIDEILPKAFVLENVKGLTLRKNRPFLRGFLAHMARLGYVCKSDLLDAADYGVPQHRLRFIVIGSRVRSPSLPKRTHSKPTRDEGKPPWRTARDAISDLAVLAAGEEDPKDSLHFASAHSEPVLEIISHIPLNGGSRRSLPDELWLPCHKKLAEKKVRGAESIYGRMKWDSPSPTMTTRSHLPSCGRFVHPEQNRGLTLREVARLQTVPDDFRISGGKDKIAMWIGNGFPTIFSEAIGYCAAEACLPMSN